MKRLIVIVAAALAAACSGMPQNDTLVQARDAYARARDNPHVTRFAPQELAEAARTLEQAEQLAAAGKPGEDVAHVAYLAEGRARIATNVAMTRAADAQLAQAERERERVQLEARAREARAAEQARVEAEQARLQAERARTEAEARLREAQAERADALRKAQRAAQLQQLEKQHAAEQQGLRAELRTLESQVAALQTKETERGMVLTLGADVLFDTGQSTLKAGARRALDNVARLMQRRPELSIVVEGFTDSVGGDDFNRSLSQRRAQAVKRALVQEGIEAGRIATRGMGESFPVASNSSAAGRQLNRRVEIVIPHESAAAGR
jgi:outer membrane protein OmpA-like peptidoglycan-associated protein